MARKREFDFTGPALPAPSEWKAKAKAEIKARFGSQAKFAKYIGGSQAGVSQALSPRQPTSKYVRPICEALGWPVPTTGLEANDEDQQILLWLEQIRVNSPAMYEKLQKLIQVAASALSDRNRG